MLLKESNIPDIYKQKANLAHWTRYPSWDFIESHCLLFGIEPSIEAKIDPVKFFENACEYEELDGLIVINSLLIRALETGDLKPDVNQYKRITNRWEYKFRPKTIVTCAYKLKIDIQEELSELIEPETTRNTNNEILPPYLDKKNPEFRLELKIVDEVWRYFFEDGMMDPTKPRRKQIEKYLDKRYKNELYNSGKRNDSMLNRIVTLVNGKINKWADET